MPTISCLVCQAHPTLLYREAERKQQKALGGADVNAKGPPLNLSPLLVPLWAAGLRGSELLDQPANLDIGFSDKELNLALKKQDAMAAQSIRKSWPNLRDVLELLLSRGADVNQKGLFGTTLLHSAAGDGLKDAAELFIAHGVDVNAKDNEGQTPLSVAKEEGHEEIVELLRKHGAKE